MLVSSAGLHLPTCPYSVGRVWAGGWLVLDGLACVYGGHLAVSRTAGFSSSVFLPVVSHPLAGWPRLVHVAAVLEEQQETKLQDPLRPRLRTGSPTAVTLLHAIGPGKSQASPGVRGGEIGSTS